MRKRWAPLGPIVACMMVCGCPKTLPTTTASSSATPHPPGVEPAGSPTPALVTAGSPTPSGPPVAAASPRGVVPDATLHQGGVVFGTVLGQDGLPAAGVRVRGFILSNNGGSLIAPNSTKLIGDHGSEYRLAEVQADLETTTDDGGRFTLTPPADKTLNIEAVQSETSKALVLGVVKDAHDLVLKLAPTGSVRGQVGAKDPGVTDFEGTDVFIPGTSYVAKAAKDGSYTLSGVPVGTFMVVASKAGIGRAEADGVAVGPNQTTTAPALQLATAAPTLASIEPANGGPGTVVTLKGDGLGASTGQPLQVSLGGVLAEASRVDDHVATFKVPAIAPSGNAVVTVAGLASQGIAFTVLKSLDVTPKTTFLHVGSTTAFTVSAVDTAGKPVAKPVVTWRVEGTAASVTDGSVKALAAGSATLVVASGDLAVRLPLTITASEVLPYGNVGTVAGSVAGYADGPVATALFTSPAGMALDRQDNVYVAEGGVNGQVRKITPAGTVSTVGPAHTVVTPGAVAVDAAGNVYATAVNTGAVWRFAPDGKATLLAGGHADPGYAEGVGAAAQFAYPLGIAVDAQGMIYVADSQNNRIRLVAPDGTVSTFAGSANTGAADGPALEATFNRPAGLAFDSAGTLYVSEQWGVNIRCIAMAQEGHPVSTRPGGGAAQAITVDTFGNAFTVDPQASQVRKVTPDGVVSVVAGGKCGGITDGPVASACFGAGPVGLVVDSKGTLYVADTQNHRIRKVTP